MKLLILPDAAAAAARVVDEIRDLVDQKPEARLGLATGGTMEPVYEGLVKSDADLRRVTTFNLDEYVGLSPQHPQSYRSFMEARLFGPKVSRRRTDHTWPEVNARPAAFN